MKHTYNITFKRSWDREENAKSVDVVGGNIDGALDRFWVHRWKTSRDKRGQLDILRVVRGSEVVV